MDTWKSAFEAMDELKPYGDNSLGLFALALKFNIDDLHGVAADAITDGSDDKKLDIVYIDSENEYAVIAQCYFCNKEKDKAPANKASDLNTGLAWLIQRNIDEIPQRIKPAAQNFRECLKSKAIKTIYIWYIHNLPESENVNQELITVHQSAATMIQNSFSDIGNVNIQCYEVGQQKLTTWYEECQSPILVNETLAIDCKDGYEINGENWSAYSTAIPASVLHKLYKKHKTKIFSANIRDYLGSRTADSNINYGIKNTAENEAGNFWAYNNGLTILTHKFQKKPNAIDITGFSIVNGAQTTGAIGSLKKLPHKDVMVQARFIAINNGNQDLIQKIIQYNNSQNKVEAADFRSTDKIQKRLKEEISKIPNIEYEGGRRGGAGDAIRRRPGLLSSYAVGQAMAAFHGDPITAYNKKSGIWISDNLYSKYFSESTKAVHLVCVHSLIKAIEDKKTDYIAKQSLTDIEEKTLTFFRKRGSIYLFAAAISSCLETIIDRPIPNLFRINFGVETDHTKAKSNWFPVIDTLLPFCTQLNPAIEFGLKNTKDIESAILSFKSLVAATATYNKAIYETFKSKLKPV